MNFPSPIFFNDINHGYRAAILKKNPVWLLPFYMVVATYFYYEKVCRMMCTTIVSHLLKKDLSFWTGATETGSALVASACCMLARSIFYWQQMKRSEKQCKN